MPDIMKMGKNPNYLGSWDVEETPNKEITLTISKIVDEDVVANGTKERCTVCYWTDSAFKPMVLNITNKKTLCKLYKTKDTEKLIGKSVVVGVEQVKAFGDVFEALRIRRRIPKLAAPAKCADCGKYIAGASGKSAEYIAGYTKKQFGVALCYDCAIKRNEVKQHAAAEADG